MNRKMLCLAVAVVITTVCVFTYLASAAPQGKGNDRVLSKIKFIHYKKAPGKPSRTPGGKPDKNDEGYYTYIANGAKWAAPATFYLNRTNLGNVALDDISDAVGSGITEWNTAGGTEGVDLPIFYDFIVNDTIVYDGQPLGYNTICFDVEFENSNVIAYAEIWGYFGGRPSQREIVEAHIELNDNDYTWGLVTSPTDNLMDVQNILTHELGHCAGMGDLYKTEAIEETMFGLSSVGETDKRTLYKGDIAGILNLYQ